MYSGLHGAARPCHFFVSHLTRACLITFCEFEKYRAGPALVAVQGLLMILKKWSIHGEY